MKSIIILLITIAAILSVETQTHAQEIWGMTKYGGTWNKGVIFKMDEKASTQEVVFSFEAEGLPEGKMTEYSEGVFYGMTTDGGEYGYGIIYRFESGPGSFTRILSFEGEVSGKDGSGSMVFASNGKFYGMTVTGGIHDKGILFEFEPATETFIKKVDFDGNEKGSEPLGSLIEGSDGNLYGMTSMGGIYDAGVLFGYDYTSGSFTKLADFNGEDMGSNPMGSLTEASDNRLYGMTRWGGANNYGVIFRFDPANKQFNTLFNFDGEESGRNPHGSLTEASNGKLYGTTPFGGAYNLGVLFEFDYSLNSYLKKYDFTGLLDIRTYGTLTLASNDNLYAVIHNSFGVGFVLMEFDPELDIIQEISYQYDDLRDYYGSMESMVMSANGKMYFWGRDIFFIDNEVYLFEFDPESGTITRHFSNSSSSTGNYPLGHLVEAVNGKLYATTSRGGIFDCGVLFEFDPVSNKYRKIIDFDGVSKGANPLGSLLSAKNAKLYGMTREGGFEGKGVLFEFDPVTEEYTKIFDFNGDETGEYPCGSLIQGTDNKLYGMAALGGAYGYGVLFALDPSSGSFEKYIDFNGTEKGRQPYGSLIQASDGNLYGVTKFGGIANKGVLFEYNIHSDNFLKLNDCQNMPVELMQASNGMIYGSGVYIFEYDPLTKAFNEIKEIPASGSIGKLLEISDDTLLGMDFGEIAYQDGIEDRGKIFELDLINYNTSVVLKFNGPNGKHPDNSSLMQINRSSKPVAVCKNITLYLNESGQAMLHPADIDNGSSGSKIELEVSKNIFSCSNIGENSITLTVADENKNSATCNAMVLVADTIPPDAVCRDIEVVLDADGRADIVIEDIDSGSYDACGIQSMTMGIKSFTCDDVGENSVELTVTDNNGNSSVCYATVEVSDTIPPVAKCTDIEVALDVDGNAVIEAGNIDNGSLDACGILTRKLDVTTFTCENIGENTVELVVTDINENNASCMAVVNVVDRIFPEITCVSNKKVFLDPYRDTYKLLISEWVPNVTDNCRIESPVFSINRGEPFTISSRESFELEAGVNDMIWKASDGAGNISSCASVITIEKRPTALRILKNEVNIKEGEIRIEAALMDELLENGVKGKMLMFEFKGSLETAVTNGNGIAAAALPYDEELSGSEFVDVSFPEDANYSGSRLEAGLVTGTNGIAISGIKVYPNPFSEKLTIEFVSPQSAEARIDIVDPAGRLVKTIFNQPVEAGMFYKAQYSPKFTSSGYLIYRIIIDNEVQSGKVIYRQ